MSMDCDDVRRELADLERGRLPTETARLVEAHLVDCAGCRAVRARESALDEALARLPRYETPAALKSKLAARLDEAAGGLMRAAQVRDPMPPSEPQVAPTRPPKRPSRAAFFLGSGLFGAVVATMALAMVLARGRVGGTHADEERLIDEATNDHLRILYAEHPLDIESGGIHRVKPWFAGKLDFAPVTAFEGDDDFPLQGGAVAYFVDRKAAALVYKRRLHTLSLFIFRAEGLGWPTAGIEPMGRVKARVQMSHGFNVALWRDGELGYALVSDITATELLALGSRIAGDR